MGNIEHWDATNSVRLCDRCEAEQGVGAGADKGDRACSCCGAHEANHVYPALDRGAVERAAERAYTHGWVDALRAVRAAADGKPQDWRERAHAAARG